MAHVKGSKWPTESEQLLTDLVKQGKMHKEIAEIMGLTVSTVEGKVKRMRDKGTRFVPLPKTVDPGIINFDLISRQYDTRETILRELAAIPTGTVVENGEFGRRVAGVDRPRFNRCVELHSEEFKQNRVQMRLGESREAKWYWGHPEFIAKVRSLVEKYK